MPFQDDIYRKDGAPSLLKKRRPRKRTGRQKVRDESSPDENADKLRLQRNKEPLPGGAHHHHRRHAQRRSRRKSTHPVSKSGLILWSSVSALLLLYIGSLIYLRVADSMNDGAAVAPPVIQPTALERDIAQAPEEYEGVEVAALAARIKDWKASSRILLSANTMLEEGEVSNAVNRLERALEKTPENLKAKYTLALTLLEQKEYPEVERRLMEILEAAPERFDVQVSLAETFIQEGKFEEAIEMCGWIIEEDPYAHKAHRMIARAYMNSDKTSRAIPHLRKLITYNPSDAVAENNLALAYSELGEYEKAVNLFENMLGKSDANPATYYNLAVCYTHQKNREKALELISEARNKFGESFVQTWMNSEDLKSLTDLGSTEDATLEPSTPPAREGTGTITAASAAGKSLETN